MKKIKKVVVLGGGSFGTVLANLAASNGHHVSLWVRDSEQALRINSEGANATYHPELKLSENIQASDSLESIMKNASIVFIATPSIVFEQIIKRISKLLEDDSYVISCTKGIKGNPFRTLSDIIKDGYDTIHEITSLIEDDSEKGIAISYGNTVLEFSNFWAGRLSATLRSFYCRHNLFLFN